MDPAWSIDLPSAARIPLTALATYVAVVLFTRLNGLRSFARMSAFDFAMTVAVGSTMATTILAADALWWEGLLALASLFVLQRVVAFLRRWRLLERALDNSPKLLLRDGIVSERNLKRCHMTHEDLRSKIREAGLLRMEDAAAVVMETTGVVSVLPKKEGVELSEDLLSGVR